MINKKLTAGILALVMLLGTACGSSTPGAPAPADNAGTETAEEPSEGGSTEEESAEEGGAEAESVEPGEAAAGDTGTETGNTETAPAEPAAPPVDPMTLYDPHEETVTFMIYMTGSDLESSAAAATNDMAEIADSGIDLEKVNLLVFTGGAPVWHSEDPEIPTDANVLYRLTEGGYEEVERLDPLSMGDSANLERFLAYSYENYPAESYDLVLWDHGNGPVIGYGSDKQYGGDSLTLPEMREALEASPFGEDNKLALIGFDACLMSSAELMCVCAPYAQYMVASQETEPSFGWNYAFLGVAGKISTRDLSREIVREYNAYCREYFAGNEFFQSDVTLAAIDLSYGEEMEEALDALFTAASGDVSGDYNKLARARVNTHGFGRASTGSEYDLVDLKNLMEQMSEKYPKETAAVLEVVEKAVLVSEANVGESCGLSLFYPYYNKNFYRKAWKDEYAALETFPNYSTFLSRYEQVWMGTDLKELFNDNLVLQQGKEKDTYTMQLTPEQAENFASARYLILRREGEGIFALVYNSGNVTEKKGLLTANFDGNVIYYGDDYGDKDIPPTIMYETVDGMTDYTVFAHVGNDDAAFGDDKVFVEIQFAVKEETGELTVKGIYRADDEEEISTGKKEPIDPNDWKFFLFMNITGRYLTRDENGRVIPFFDWPEGDWITGKQLAVANGLNFTFEPLYEDGNEYYIMFEVSDVQNNRYASELLPIMMAEAPPQTETREPVELNWEEGSEFVFLEEQGSYAGLRLLTDASTGNILIQEFAHAGEEYPVRFHLEHILLNGNISTGTNSATLWIEPGEDKASVIDFLKETCRLAGIQRPETISFDLTLSREDTDGYLIYKQPYVIHLGDKVESQIRRVPVLGAQAQSQLLAKEQDVDIQLMQLGDAEPIPYYSEPDLHVSYKITNNASEQREVNLYGLIVNGVFFESKKNYTLEPGDVWYVEQKVDGDYVRQISTGYLYSEREDRLQSISEVQAVMEIGDQFLMYPVELSMKGDQDKVVPQGDVLYEDDQFRIRLDSFHTEEGKDEGTTNYVWDVWVENNSSAYQTYKLSLEGSDAYDYLALYTIPPGTVTLEQLYIPSESEISDISVILTTRNPDEDAAVAREPFTIPAK